MGASEVVGAPVYDRTNDPLDIKESTLVTTFPPQDEAHFPAGRYVLAYTDDLPQGGVVFLKRWEDGRPLVSGSTGMWLLDLPAVRMMSSHASFARGQAARLAACGEELMTDGELRLRVVAYERELPWAPTVSDVEAYRAWRERTADTRAAAERADGELKSRGIDRAAEPKVTAAEWLDAQDQRPSD
jgi:hypothetical protein